MVSNSDSKSLEIYLWNSFKKGDAMAFSRLYALLIHDLLRYGARITANRQLVRDSIQDLFLDLWRCRENLSDTNSVKFYLYRSLRNRIARNLPAELVRQHTATDTPEPPAEALWIEHETTELQTGRLRRALARLPKRQQEAIQLRYYHNFTPEEIGVIMEINIQSARNLLHRAIEYLREVLVFWFLPLACFLD